MADGYKDDLRYANADLDAPLRPGQEWTVELAQKDGRTVLSFMVVQDGKRKTYRTEDEKKVTVMVSLLNVLKDAIDMDFKYSKKLAESP